MARRRVPGLGLVITAWLVSRIIVLSAMWGTATTNNRTFSQGIRNWDVLHFYRLADKGYVTTTDPAFFPGLPLLLNGFGRLGISHDIAGMVLSTVFSLLTVLALYRLGERRKPGVGAFAAAAWCFAPTAVFTVVPYTESLFCALAFWSWEMMRRRSWLPMALLAAGACTVRVSGLFLVGALAVALVIDERRDRGLRGLPWLLLPVATLGGYVVYQYRRTGDWMAWYTAQKSGWERGFAWPWESFLNTLPPIWPGYADHPDWRWVFLGEVLSMLFGLVSVIVLLARRRVGEASWVAVQVLAFSLSYWWMSVNRATLLWFPMWILIGEAMVWSQAKSTSGRRLVNGALFGVLGVCILVLILWTNQFSVGAWSS